MDRMDGVIISQNQGGRYRIPGRGRGNMALKYLISLEGKGERIKDSVVDKVGSDVSWEVLQKGSS